MRDQVAVRGDRPDDLGPALVGGEQPGVPDGDGARKRRSGEQDGGGHPGLGPLRCFGGPAGYLGRLRAEADHPQPAAVVQPGVVRGVGEQDVRREGGELPLPGERHLDVDDGVGTAGLEGGQEGDDDLGPAGGPDGHDGAGRQSVGYEVVRQLVGADVQLPIGEAVRVGDDGVCLRGVPRLLLEQVQDGVGGRPTGAVGPGFLRRSLRRCLGHPPMMAPPADSGQEVRTSPVRAGVRYRSGQKVDLKFG